MSKSWKFPNELIDPIDKIDQIDQINQINQIIKFQFHMNPQKNNMYSTHYIEVHWGDKTNFIEPPKLLK